MIVFACEVRGLVSKACITPPHLAGMGLVVMTVSGPGAPTVAQRRPPWSGTDDFHDLRGKCDSGAFWMNQRTKHNSTGFSAIWITSTMTPGGVF